MIPSKNMRFKEDLPNTEADEQPGGLHLPFSEHEWDSVGEDYGVTG